MTVPRSALPPAWAPVVAGLLSGLAGALGFALWHAILIVPIWGQLGWGLAAGAVTGAVGAAALLVLEPVALTPGVAPLWPQRLWHGARFGAQLWLLVVPVTLADALLRRAGLPARLELVAVAAALGLATGSGALFGWWRTRTRRGLIVGAAATLMLTIAMAGPVPIGRSARAVGIFLSVLPCAALGGGAVVLVTQMLARMDARGRNGESDAFVPDRPTQA